MKKLPLLRLGVAFVLPAPPTLITPLVCCFLTTLPMFCIKFASLAGIAPVHSPAVVALTYKGVPELYALVSNALPAPPEPYKLPNVTICTAASVAALSSAKPKAGILAASLASALATFVSDPELACWTM